MIKEKQCFSKAMGTENLPLSCIKEAIIIDERKEPAILMTIVITEKDTKKFELGFSRWW